MFIYITASAKTWRTVHEHIVADVFCYSTACGDYKREIHENLSRVCKTSNC